MKKLSKSEPESANLFVTVPLPRGLSPALAASLQSGVEQAICAIGLDLSASLLSRADDLAKLITRLTQPDAGLIEERVLRRKTMQAVFEQGEWLTSEDINRLQASPPRNKSRPASDWKRRGHIFAVSYDGTNYFARYQFDDGYRPLPIIKDILQEIGEVADAWETAAWFHYPSGWIADLVDGTKPIAPKDALKRRDEVLTAARRMRGTYEA
ncbi:hypothetical protein [Caballeronia concitans]|uniref:Uncharacterized protein n=1 Tax=Caballeronia concitans TaxID=1777133 RepID=A0A658R4Z4_9BURK|nr:hypothetical protein [Caballeronia concitans]SAL51243.1 hypothetical protein AWB72_05417 [Caballeronia concitans]